MRTSSIAPAALLTLLALRTAHAQPAAAGAPAPSAPPAPAEPKQATRESDAVESDAGEARASGVQLEDPEPSQGHFIALGVHGVGALAYDESRGTRQPTFGTGFSLRLGEAVTDWLSLSLAFALGSTGGEPQDSLTFGRFGITSQWYFTERWFLQAGFAAANVQGPDPEDHELSRGRYGDVYLTGIGRDLFLSDSEQSGGWVVTPLLTAEVGPNSKFTTTSLWLGVELSWWNGLTQDKLNLPATKAYTKK
jgi:hypothetical protein